MSEKGELEDKSFQGSRVHDDSIGLSVGGLDQ